MPETPGDPKIIALIQALTALVPQKGEGKAVAPAAAITGAANLAGRAGAQAAALEQLKERLASGERMTTEKMTAEIDKILAKARAFEATTIAGTQGKIDVLEARARIGSQKGAAAALAAATSAETQSALKLVSEKIKGVASGAVTVSQARQVVKQVKPRISLVDEARLNAEIDSAAVELRSAKRVENAANSQNRKENARAVRRSRAHSVAGEFEQAEQIASSVTDVPQKNKLLDSIERKRLKVPTGVNALFKKGSRLKHGLIGASGVALLASLFKGKGEQEVDPQLQAQLFQAMQQRQGGAGDEAALAGRNLLNLKRTLDIVKTLQSLGGLSERAQATPII